MVKVYEEMLVSVDENFNKDEYKFWLNEILDDEKIPYENKIVLKDSTDNPLDFNNDRFYVEVYVYKSYEKEVLELIEIYLNADFASEEILELMEEEFEKKDNG